MVLSNDLSEGREKDRVDGHLLVFDYRGCIGVVLPAFKKNIDS